MDPGREALSKKAGNSGAIVTLAIGLVIGGGLGWWFHSGGPTAMPSPCERLNNDYAKTVDLMHQVAPLGVQLNSGGFDSTYVDVAKGESGSILVVDRDRIDAEWVPRFESITAREAQDYADCVSSYPDGIRP
jgi:hypothetical protein